jgi:hypothetical protein
MSDLLPTIDSLTQDQEQRVLCLSYAVQLTAVPSTFPQVCDLARWLYDGSSP